MSGQNRKATFLSIRLTRTPAHDNLIYVLTPESMKHPRTTPGCFYLKGFSMPELLVVLVIIGILVLIALLNFMLVVRYVG